jgi:uncharacterized protein (TIGR02099 family)
MIKNILRKIKLLTQWLGLVTALLIIGMVILIFLGRQTIGQLDEVRPSIESFISSSTGLQVNLGSLSGEWPQLFPIIDVEGLELIDSQQDPVLKLQGARADLDFFNSILFAAPIWRELVVDELEINFDEDASGHWRLKGLDAEGDNDLNVVLEPFLHSRHIRLKSLKVNFNSFSGQQTQLFGSDMLIENDDDFHRAQLSVSVTENDKPARLILEAYGQLSDLETFNVDGYLKFEEFDFSESLKMLSRSLVPDVSVKLDQYSTKTSGEIWIDILPGGRLDYKGSLSLSEVPLNWLADNAPPISDIKATLAGWYQFGQDWGARLQDLQFALGSKTIDSINLLFTQQLGSNWQEFDVSINHLNLALVADLIYEAKLLSVEALNNLKNVQLSGNLSSLRLGRADAGLYMQTNLNGCYMKPFKGIPGLKDIDGYIEVKDSNGLFHIADNNGFEMYFPKSYRDYLSIHEAKGTIYFDWQSPNQRLIFSDIINTKLEAGDSQLKFTIEQPLGRENKVADFNLLMGARNLDLSQTQKYLPYTMPDRSSKWVRNAIKQGNLNQFGLLFRAGPPKNNRLSRTMQLLFETDDAVINFNPNWPQLDSLDGLFLMDNGNLSAQIQSAHLDRAAVNKTRIEYSVKPPIEERKWIIDGHLEADLSAMIDILDQSPLSEKLGPMANWNYSGKTTTQLHMELPSYIADKNNPPKTDYLLNTLIYDGEMVIKGSPIVFEQLTGDIEFSSERGIYSDNLNASLWGEPFAAKLYRDNQQQMSYSTVLAPSSLNKFSGLPWQKIFSDSIAVTGTLSKDANNPAKTTLEINSDMQGVAINLPAPLGKKADKLQQLALKLHFDPNLSQLEGTLGEHLLSDLRYDQSRLRRGVISFDHALDMPDQDMLLISANLPSIDLKLWQPLGDLMAENPNSSNPVETVFDLKLAQWEVSGIQLSDVSARIKPLSEGFDAVFISDLADGSVSVFRDLAKPPKIALNRLELTESQGGNAYNLDPRLLTAADFSVDWLSIAGRELGSLSFELRPEPSGASFNNITGNIFGLQPGIYASEAPTEFFWGYDGNTHISKLVGPIGINDIGNLFNAFSLPQVMDSQSGRLDANIAWRSEPWAISKDNLKGDFKINLVDGNFYRTPGGAGTALKLVGLFNFANWLKRLQLDFSDVVGQNLAYNRLDGILSFDQSVLSLNEPLKIQMPSGKMTMAGDFDLDLEAVDAQLVATLPVATNLPWLAGLTGGLPAALGVYATSKLVEKQVDRLSSISYKISGSWDDVELAVDKIFAAELTKQSEK